MPGPRPLRNPKPAFLEAPASRPAQHVDGARDPDAPLVLVRTVAAREIIVAASGSALARSIRPGMTLGEARAICADVRHAEHEPHRDAVALEALARWLTRFSPMVAIADPLVPHSPPSTPSLPTLHGLFIDLTGCERVFGGIDVIVARVRDALARMRITAQLAVAPTPGAAWALASPSAQRDDGRIVTHDQLAAALDDLSPAALRLDDETVRSLHHLGLCTIGQLLRLPRELLPARFGPQVLLRIDQALGRVAEPLTPVEPFAPIQARIDFDGPVSSFESLWTVFQQLIGQIVAELARRGRGAREVQVEFFLPYARDGARTICKTIRLSRASRDAVKLFNLIRCATETLDVCADRRDRDAVDDGFWGLRLNVPVSERVADEQIALLEHEQFADEQELSHLVERLCARLGDDAVVRPELVESHVPEKAWEERSEVRGQRSEKQPRQISDLCPLTSLPTSRPLHLLGRPTEVRVMVSPSEDRDGRPVAFTDDAGVVHRLRHAAGPERIAGRWWAGHDKTRDYFDVESESPSGAGTRFWIFRVTETGRWFLHGRFD